MRRISGLIAVAVWLSLSACGGSAGPEASESPTSAETSTVNQFSSVVAASEGPLRDGIYFVEVEQDEMGFGDWLLEARSKMPAMQRDAGSLASDLQELGAPPAEIEDLVTETIATLEDFASMPDWEKVPNNVLVADVESVLDGWKPYL